MTDSQQLHFTSVDTEAQRGHVTLKVTQLVSSQARISAWVRKSHTIQYSSFFSKVHVPLGGFSAAPGSQEGTAVYPRARPRLGTGLR